jgi:acyl-coenzyme A thioesterase PaaI-like protein
MDLHTAMPFTALLGATAVVIAPEEVWLRLDWDPDRCTAGGVLHGGALMGPADAAGGRLDGAVPADRHGPGRAVAAGVAG